MSLLPIVRGNGGLVCKHIIASRLSQAMGLLEPHLVLDDMISKVFASTQAEPEELEDLNPASSWNSYTSAGSTQDTMVQTQVSDSQQATQQTGELLDIELDSPFD